MMYDPKFIRIPIVFIKHYSIDHFYMHTLFIYSHVFIIINSYIHTCVRTDIITGRGVLQSPLPSRSKDERCRPVQASH